MRDQRYFTEIQFRNVLILVLSSALHFHWLLSDPIRKSKWISNIRHENGMPSKQSTICSDHLTENSLDRGGKSVRLLPDAVTKSFKAFPKHFKQVSNFSILLHFYSFIMFFSCFIAPETCSS